MPLGQHFDFGCCRHGACRDTVARRCRPMVVPPQRRSNHQSKPTTAASTAAPYQGRVPCLPVGNLPRLFPDEESQHIIEQFLFFSTGPNASAKYITMSGTPPLRASGVPSDLDSRSSRTPCRDGCVFRVSIFVIASCGPSARISSVRRPPNHSDCTNPATGARSRSLASMIRDFLFSKTAENACSRCGKEAVIFRGPLAVHSAASLSVHEEERARAPLKPSFFALTLISCGVASPCRLARLRCDL